MLSLSSNCCRIDSVKATANQLKIQLAQANSANAPDPKTQSANGQLQSLDAQIRTGNADKAELALSSARTAIEQLQYSPPGHSTTRTDQQPPVYGSLSVYA